MVERLPEGLQTLLGEGGGLLSGGEGQRVRVGRGLLHARAAPGDFGRAVSRFGASDTARTAGTNTHSLAERYAAMRNA